MRAVIALGLLPLPVGALFLLLGASGLFVSDWAVAVRAAGIAMWFIYLPALAAERLRVWPFDRLPGQESV